MSASFVNDTLPAALGVPLGGIPGPGRHIHPNIVFLALYNFLLIGILARFFSGSTTLAYTWRPGLFTFLRIFAFCLRIWLGVHGISASTATRHMFIAQALLVAAAPMILISAALMLVRNSARAYKPTARRGQQKRTNVLRIVTYVLEFGLLCMGMLYVEAAIGYTDAIQGSQDDMRRLRNIWRATSIYEVINVLAAATMIAVLTIQYCQGSLNLDRVPHPHLEARKLVLLALLNILLFLVAIFRAVQVDKSSPSSKVNGDAVFYGFYCVCEFLAAAFFVLFNYERMMPRSSRSSRAGGNDPNHGPSSPRTGRVHDPEKGSNKDPQRPRGPGELRILALAQSASIKKSNGSQKSFDSASSTSTTESKTKSGRNDRASSIFHERFRRASQAEGSSSDERTPPPPALITDPRIMQQHQHPDPERRYKLVSEIRRQEREERGSADDGEVLPPMPPPVTITPSQDRPVEVPESRRRVQRAIVLRGQQQYRQTSGSDSVRPKAPPSYVSDASSRSRDSHHEPTGPRLTNVPVVPTRVVSTEYAPRGGPDQVSPRSMAATIETMRDEEPVSPKTVVNGKATPSPGVAALFRMWYRAPATANPLSQIPPVRSPVETQTHSPAGSPRNASTQSRSTEDEQYFSPVSLATPVGTATVQHQQQQQQQLRHQQQEEPYRKHDQHSPRQQRHEKMLHSMPGPKATVSRSSTTMSRGGGSMRVSRREREHDETVEEEGSRRGGGRRDRDRNRDDLPPPSADMSSLHSFHLGEFTPTPRVLKAERGGVRRS